MENLYLDEIRREIDKLDIEIVKLLEKRIKIVKKVALYKIENNKKIFDEIREKEVISKNLSIIENKDIIYYMEKIIQNIMDISKEYQSDIIKEKNNKRL